MTENQDDRMVKDPAKAAFDLLEYAKRIYVENERGTSDNKEELLRFQLECKAVAATLRVAINNAAHIDNETKSMLMHDVTAFTTFVSYWPDTWHYTTYNWSPETRQEELKNLQIKRDALLDLLKKLNLAQDTKETVTVDNCSDETTMIDGEVIDNMFREFSPMSPAERYFYIPEYPFRAGYVYRTMEDFYLYPDPDDLDNGMKNATWDEFLGDKKLAQEKKRCGKHAFWFFTSALKKWMDHWFGDWGISDLKALLREYGITKQGELDKLSWGDIQSIVRIKMMKKKQQAEHKPAGKKQEIKEQHNETKLAEYNRTQKARFEASAKDDLTDTERNILKALAGDTLTGAELLKRAGYDSSSHYRTILSNLCKRDILGNDGKGYFKK